MPRPIARRRVIETVRTQQETHAEAPTANIVFCRDDADNYFQLGLSKTDGGWVFREADSQRNLYGLVVQFRNEPKPPLRTGKATNVHATVLYHDLDDPEEQDVVGVRIEEPYWINELSPVISFDIGQARYLLLGIFKRISPPVNMDYNFQVYDRKTNDLALGTGSPITFKIVTKLSWGEHREFGVESTFELRMRLDGKPFERFYELLEVAGRVGDNQQPIKISRGKVTLR